MKTIRNSIVTQFIVCPILIFWILLHSASAAIIQRKLTLEDCQEWVEEETDEPNEVAHAEKRIFNLVFDSLMFFVFQSIWLSPFQKTDWPFILLMTVFLWLLYYPFMEYKTGKTIAKFITQTHVISNDGTRLEPRQALYRNLFRFFPFEVLSFLKTYPIGLHDSLSNSQVVNDPRKPDAIAWEET